MTEPDKNGAPEGAQTIAPMSFAQQVANLANPARWILAAWLLTGDAPGEDAPDVTAVLPIPTGYSIQTWLAAQGAKVGKFRVQLQSTLAGAQGRHRFARLRQSGAVADIVTVDQMHVDEARALKAGKPPTREATEPVNVAPAVQEERERAELQKARNVRMTAELEAMRLQKQMASLQSGGDAPTAKPGGGLMELLAPLIPIAVEAVRGIFATQKQTAEALSAAVAAMQHGPAPVAAPTGLGLGALLELVPQLKALSRLFPAMARDDEADDGGELGGAAGLLRGVNELLGRIAPVGAQPAPEPVEQLPAPARRARRSPEEEMQFRVSLWLMRVLSEHTATADPASAADRLFAGIGALPAGFRQLLHDSQSVDQLLAGLPQWLPGDLRITVPNDIRRDAAKQEWLRVFLETVHELAGENAGAPEDN